MSTTPHTPVRDTTVREQIDAVLQDEFSINESGYGIEQLEDALNRLERIVITEKRQLLERLTKSIDGLPCSSIGSDEWRIRKNLVLQTIDSELAALQGDTGALHE